MALKEKDIYSASLLAKELKVSDRYLKRILTTLSNSSIIRSVQGRSGGFQLLKKMEDISLYDIIQSVESVDKYRGCVLGFMECSAENPCLLHDRWIPIQKDLINLFKRTTVLEISENSKIFKI